MPSYHAGAQAINKNIRQTGKSKNKEDDNNGVLPTYFKQNRVSTPTKYTNNIKRSYHPSIF